MVKSSRLVDCINIGRTRSHAGRTLFWGLKGSPLSPELGQNLRQVVRNVLLVGSLRFDEVVPRIGARNIVSGRSHTFEPTIYYSMANIGKYRQIIGRNVCDLALTPLQHCIKSATLRK